MILNVQADLNHCCTYTGHFVAHLTLIVYRKVPKFSDGRKLCCNLSKVQIKRSLNRKKLCAGGMTNSVDPDQTAPLGSGSALFAKACVSENLGSLRYIFFFSAAKGA